MWRYQTRKRKDFNIVMDILEGDGKVDILQQKFTLGYYIIEFDPHDDHLNGALRFMGCEEVVERILTLDEQMFVASVEYRMAYSELKRAKKTYRKAKRKYEKTQKEYFAQSNKES